MTEIRVDTFFYGSYMNPVVLKELGVVPLRFEAARLSGYDICLRSRARLIRSEQHSVYGIVAAATQDELKRLYAHSETVLGVAYAPEAVLVRTNDEKWLPVLCYMYMSRSTKEHPPVDHAYFERIMQPAREFGFPQWYLQRLESFRPG